MKPARLRGCLAVATGALLTAPAAGQWVEQNFELQAGWNSVFLEVDPAPADADGLFGVEPFASAATGLTLHPAAPNPFREGTSLRFELPRAGVVRLGLYGVRGRLVRALVDGERPAGTHSVRWDGRDAAGRPAAAGLYFLRLEAAGEAVSGRVARVR